MATLSSTLIALLIGALAGAIAWQISKRLFPKRKTPRTISVALIALTLIAAGQYGQSRYQRYMEVEKLFTDTPLLRLLQEEMPQAVAEVKKQLASKAFSNSEAQALGRQLVLDATTRKLANSSNAALHQYARAQTAILEALLAKDPLWCFVTLYPSPQLADRLDYSDIIAIYNQPDILNDLRALFRDPGAVQPRVSAAEIENAQLALQQSLHDTFGTRWQAILDKLSTAPHTFTSPAEYAIVCQLEIHALKFLNDPQDNAKMAILRSTFIAQDPNTL